MKKYVLTAGGEILESSMLEYNNFIKEYGYWFYDDIKNKKIFEVVIYCNYMII